MPITKLTIAAFVSLANLHPVLDVRSPGEYQHAHIPGAYSLPLFTDDERKVVGTAYKQQGKQQAIRIGLDYFGTKMTAMLDEAAAFIKTYYENHKNAPVEYSVIVHCWRGGMRSAGVAWLLDLYGFKVYTLIGGYKAYRNWVLKQFETPFHLKLVGGFTGSGKTCLLQQLKKNGVAIIDLEAIASHKGSAFGALGMAAQPSQEMFENLLAKELSAIKIEAERSIWFEDESRRIGLVNIPAALFNAMRSSPMYFLEIPFEARLDHLVATYGLFDKAALTEAIFRIQKRLGGLETKQAIHFLEEADLPSCFRILLAYYDKCYLKAVKNRELGKGEIHRLTASAVDAKENASLLLQQKINNYD